MAIPAFGSHLDRLAGERGPILRKDGDRRRFRYRFINPLMQPYVLMKGLQDGRIATLISRGSRAHPPGLERGGGVTAANPAVRLAMCVAQNTGWESALN